MESLLRLSELVMTIHVHFIGKVKSRCKDLKNTLGIRHHKVQIALEWLIKDNNLYRNMKYKQEEINTLLCDDIPNGIYDTIMIGVNMVKDTASTMDIYQEASGIGNCKSVTMIPKNRDPTIIHI